MLLYIILLNPFLVLHLFLDSSLLLDPSFSWISCSWNLHNSFLSLCHLFKDIDTWIAWCKKQSSICFKGLVQASVEVSETAIGVYQESRSQDNSKVLGRESSSVAFCILCNFLSSEFPHWPSEMSLMQQPLCRQKISIKCFMVKH